MSEMLLRGDRRVLLTHMTMIGLAAILEDAGAQNVRVGWTDEMQSRPKVSADGVDLEAASAIVRDHARDHASAPSWVAASLEVEGADGLKVVGLMSPRITKLPDVNSPTGLAAWTLVSRSRHDCIDTLNSLSARLEKYISGGRGWSSSRLVKIRRCGFGRVRWVPLETEIRIAIQLRCRRRESGIRCSFCRQSARSG